MHARPCDQDQELARVQVRCLDRSPFERYCTAIGNAFKNGRHLGNRDHKAQIPSGWLAQGDDVDALAIDFYLKQVNVGRRYSKPLVPHQNLVR